MAGDDPWGEAGAQPGGAGGYLPDADFRAAMDATFGAGKWRETGGFRSQQREAALRAAGAQTVAPGHISPHSRGEPDAPGAHDITVDGLTPAQAAERVRARSPDLFSALPEDAHGGQGAHLHLATAAGTQGGDPWSEGSADPWSEAKPPRAGHGFLEEAARVGESAAGGILSGAAKLIKGAGQLADVVEQRYDIASQAAVVDSGMTPEQAVAARAHLITPTTDPWAEATARAGDAIAPANRSGLESVAHGAGEFVPLVAAAVVDPALGAAAFGAQGYGEAYDEAQAKGASEDTARTAGLANAGVQGVLGMTPIGELTAPVTAGVKGLLGVAARLGTAAAGDAALGAAMQTGSNLVAQQTYDPGRAWYEQVPQSAAMMALGGVAVHGAHEAVGGVKNALRRPEAPPLADGSPAPPAPDTIPETNAIRAYAGKGPVEAEISATPEDAAPNPVPGGASKAPKASGPIATGDYVLFDAGRNPVHGRVEGETVLDDGERGLLVRTPVGTVEVPASKAVALPGDFEAARIATGAPLEQMPQAISDIAELRRAATKGYSLFQAIRDLGGVRTRDADGSPNDIASIVDGKRLQPGVVNNKTGMSPDAMREALQQRGWFGDFDQTQAGADQTGAARSGDDIADLHEAIRKGLTKRVTHPTEAGQTARRADLEDQFQRAGVGVAQPLPEAAAKLAAWRAEQVKTQTPDMELLRRRADDLGVRSRPDASYDEVLGDVIEAEAIRGEATAADADQYEGMIDAELTPEEHEWLAAGTRGAEGEPGPSFEPEPAPGRDLEPAAEDAVGPPGAGAGGGGEDQEAAGQEPVEDAEAVKAGLRNGARQVADARRVTVDRFDIKKNKQAPSTWTAEQQDFFRRQLAEIRRAEAKGNLPENIAANDFRKAEMERAAAARASPAGEPEAVAAARRAYEEAKTAAQDATGAAYQEAAQRRSDAAEALHQAELDAGLRTPVETIAMPGGKSGLTGRNAIHVARSPDGLWRGGAEYSVRNSGGGGPAHDTAPGFATREQAIDHAADQIRANAWRDIENPSSTSDVAGWKAVLEWVQKAAPASPAHETEVRAATLEELARAYDRYTEDGTGDFKKLSETFRERAAEALKAVRPEPMPTGNPLAIAVDEAKAAVKAAAAGPERVKAAKALADAMNALDAWTARQGKRAAGPSERQNIGAETVDQNLLVGTERSARQAAKAREGPLRAKVPQRDAGDLFGAPEPEAGDLFGERDPWAPKETAPAAERPAETPKGEGYGDKNKLFTREAAEAARAKLEELRRCMQSGIDPEMVHAGITLAGYHVEAGARKFGDFAHAMIRDLGEWSAPYLRMWYNALRDYPGFDAEGMTPHDKLSDVAIEEAKASVRRGGPDLEPGGEGTAPDDPDGAQPVPPGSGGPQRGPGSPRARASEAGRGAEGGQRVPDGGAAPMGEGRAGELFSGAPGGAGGDAGGGEPGGSDIARDTGIQPDRIPTEDLDRAADEAAHLEPVAAGVHPDAASPDAPHVPADIEAALPTLFPEQRADVAFAEVRFDKPDGHGVLFTNGTGTGKTFTGGGIVKRFFDHGRKDVLILAPTRGILNAWKDALKQLGVPLHVLDGIDDAGRDVTGTTYANLASNRRLASRHWDLVVPDEAHSLSSDQFGSETTALANFRAITNHPDRLRLKAEMLMPADVDRVKALREAVPEGAMSGPAWDKWHDAQMALDDKIRAKVEELKAEPRSKAAFLSATPFAYDKSVDWAQGYLFEYPGTTGRGYNDPADGRDAFMMQHFGYRMRNGKLTKPEASVESDVMERQFHEWLRSTGALSGRVLNVDKDYDRKFALVDDAVGNKIDQAMDFLHTADEGRFLPFADVVRKRFNYLARARLLEAIKAKHVIPRIRQHLALGRKVVVFHNYNEGGGFDPFEGLEHVVLRGEDGPVSGAALAAEFHERNPYVKDLAADIRGLAAPLDQLQAAFPEALVYNGTIPKLARERAKQAFNQDGGRHNIIIVQSEAGQAGISLHDTTGRHQRATENLGLPGRPVAAIQQEGRTYRIGQASDAIFRYLNTGTNWERHAFATTIAQRAGTAENLALGDQARTLRDSFINAFLDSAPNPPARGDGKGGKAADRDLARALTEFQKAKSFYFAEAKKGGRRDSREGKDYFATPEPLGLKMVEWADIRPGDKVLEPSAGHGAIARFFPETASRTLVEPSASLASRAELSSPGADVLTHRFEDLHAVNKFDAIVMNPPFGHAGATAIEHIAKAATHLRDGGRIVALIPRGSTDEKLAKFMESPAAAGLYEVADINLPASTFERAGTKVMTRIVVLEKQMTEAGRDALGQTRQRDYSGAENIGELFDRIEHSELPARVRPAQEEAAPVRAAPGDRRDEQILSAGVRRFLEAETTHGRTGQPLYVATAAERMAGDEYKAVLAAAKRHGGYYSSFRGSGAIPGFQFPSAAERKAFLGEVTDIAPKFQRQGEPPRDLFAGIEPLTPRPEGGVYAKPAADPKREHFDQNHADLYRLGRGAGTPEQRQAEAKRLATEMGPFMEWTDADLTDAERAHLDREGTPAPVTMRKAAREYVKEFNDTGKHSLYDPDAYHDVMQRWYERQGGDRPQFQREGAAPVFYSAVERLVDQAPMRAASPGQWRATLKNAPGIKQEELQWLGVNDWLDLFPADEKVPKEAVQAFVRDHGVKVEEKVHGEPASDDEVQKLAGELWNQQLGNLVDDAMDRHPEQDEDEVRETLGRQMPHWETYEREAEDQLQSRGQYEDWTLPGRKNYRELLLTLPQIERPPATHWDTAGVMAHVRFDDRMSPDGKRVLFVEEVQSDWHQKGRDQGYRKGADPAEVDRLERLVRAHEENAVKAAERVLAEGRKLGKLPLVLEPMWAQHAVADIHPTIRSQLGRAASTWLEQVEASGHASREQGDDLRDAIGDLRISQLQRTEVSAQLSAAKSATGIPDAPFKTSWPALVMKRVIRWAVDNGYERVAWTTGEQQADRYDLTKHIGRLILHDNAAGGTGRARMDGETTRGRLVMFGPHGNQIGDHNIEGREDLERLIGPELADRIERQQPTESTGGHGWKQRTRDLGGLDLKTGGEGMRAFYDRNLVNIVNDLIKKHGGKVERGKIITTGGAYDGTPEGLAKWDEVLGKLKADAGLTPDATEEQVQAAVDALREEHTELTRAYEARDHASDARLGISKAKKADLEAEMNRISRQGREYVRILDAMDRRKHSTPEQHGFDITPQLAEAAHGGFPLFQRPGGHVGFAGRGAHLMGDLYGVPADREGPAAQAIDDVDQILTRIAPHARVKPFEKMTEAPTNAQGFAVTGATYRRGAQHVIAWSLESPDAPHTARHEAIHALKNAGLFTPAEWATLEKASTDQGWLDRYDIGQRYSDVGWEHELEESIAEAYADWAKGSFRGLPAPVRALFGRIKQVLDAVRSAMRRTFGQGVTAEDIFRRVESGEVGARTERQELAKAVKFERKREEGGVSRRELLRGGAAMGAALPAEALARTPIRSEAFEAAVRSGDAARAVDWIAKNSKDPLLRDVAAKIARGGLGKSTIEVVDGRPDDKWDGLGGQTVSKDDGSHITVVRRADKDNGLTEQTVLHEAIHAWVMARFRTLSTYLPENRALLKTAPKSGDAAVDNFVRLWGTWRAAMDAKHPSLIDTTGTYDDKELNKLMGRPDPAVWAQEMWSSPDEALVRALTDPDAQAFLKAHDMAGNPAESPSASMWGRFVSWLANLFGVKVEDRSAFGHLLEASNSLFRAGTLDAPDYSYNQAVRARVSADRPQFQRQKREEGTGGGFINRALGHHADRGGKRLAAAMTRAVPDPLLELVDESKMALSPMGSGSTRAQAAAKDFANELRTSAYQWGRVDEWLNKKFTRDQQQKMWEAADQEGVLRRRDVTPGAGEGINRLTDEERAAVLNLQARADAAFDQASDLGMVNSEGLESYVPRMVVEMTAAGPRILSKASPRQARRGGNLSTTTGQLRHRKYETVEETEAAAREHFGKGATVVRNIRTLGLATQRLERAIAGRVLVNKIKALSRDAGADLVLEGGTPDPHAYFTLDHPALQQWRPKFIHDEQSGKTVAATDQNGDTIFEATPIWISREFEGPLKAVLSSPTSGVVRALTDLKGKMMSVIMYSPLMHNAVIWGKAIPADPRGVLSLQAYRRGNVAKRDPATMEEAMRAGLDPIGRRFFNQDVTSIAEGQQIVPGRSWTSQLLAYVPGLVDPKAGEAVKAAVDKVGDVWHNTFLWDRVADLQMGLYVHIRDQLSRQASQTGIQPRDAQRIAAHFANRYAGSLPLESMSKLSREMANLLLFSRSFTLGNLAAYKDIVKGLPSDVRSQILRDSGAEALERVQGAARQKAIGMMVLDVGLSYVGLFLAAAATAWLTQQKFQPPWENEAERQKRFLIGYQDDGTAVYGRLPTGKVGEELQDWATEPREILLRKLSPYGRLLYAVTANDKGFGRKLFLPDDTLAKNAGRVTWFAMQAVAPVGQLQGASDAFTGASDRKTAMLQALAPIAGVTISKGAPGGPAMSDYYKAKDAHDFRVTEALPDIRRQIIRGDIAGAQARMRDLGVAPGLQAFYIRTARAPGSRLSGRHLADFNRYATPEQKAQLARDRAAAAERRAAEDPTP